MIRNYFASFPIIRHPISFIPESILRKVALEICLEYKILCLFSEYVFFKVYNFRGTSFFLITNLILAAVAAQVVFPDKRILT